MSSAGIRMPRDKAFLGREEQKEGQRSGRGRDGEGGKITMCNREGLPVVRLFFDIKGIVPCLNL